MPSASDLDFWLGTWHVRWGPAETDRGRNVVTRTFGGYVVEERFDGRPGIELHGMSVSVFDEHRGLWRQTWVDDSGTYFALEGGVEGDAFVLVCRDHNAAEEHAVFRMRFSRHRHRLPHLVLGALARRGGDLRGALAHRLRAGLGLSCSRRPGRRGARKPAGGCYNRERYRASSVRAPAPSLCVREYCKGGVFIWQKEP